VQALKTKMMIIIVAHRLATLKLVDHIYVIDNGKVIQTGSYEKLVKDPNSYLSKSIQKEVD